MSIATRVLKAVTEDEMQIIIDSLTLEQRRTCYLEISTKEYANRLAVFEDLAFVLRVMRESLQSHAIEKYFAYLRKLPWTKAKDCAKIVQTISKPGQTPLDVSIEILHWAILKRARGMSMVHIRAAGPEHVITFVSSYFRPNIHFATETEPIRFLSSDDPMFEVFYHLLKIPLTDETAVALANSHDDLFTLAETYLALYRFDDLWQKISLERRCRLCRGAWYLFC
jgi:hypothetical protein